MASSDADLSKLSAAELVARLSDSPGDLDAVARVLSAREAQHRALQAEICALRKDSARIQEELQDLLTAALSDVHEELQKGAFKLDALLAGRYFRWEGTVVAETYAEHKERLRKIAAEVRAKVRASFSKVRVEDQQQQQQDQDEVAPVPEAIPVQRVIKEEGGQDEEIAPVTAAAISVQQQTVVKEEGDQDEAAEQQRRQQVMRDEVLDIMQELDRKFGARLRPYRAQMQQILIQKLNTPLPPVPSIEELWRWLQSPQQASPVQKTVVKEEGHLGTVSEHGHQQRIMHHDEELMREVHSYFQTRLRHYYEQKDQIKSGYISGTKSAGEASRGTS